MKALKSKILNSIFLRVNEKEFLKGLDFIMILPNLDLMVNTIFKSLVLQ